LSSCARCVFIYFFLLPVSSHHNYNAIGYLTSITRHDNASELYWQANSRYDDGGLATAYQGGSIQEKDFDTLGRLCIAHKWGRKVINGTNGVTINLKQNPQH
jgi:hypothetical protein